ncbi:MAG: hypothetical protein NT009_06160 [Proteobacteria bacterium]|nr:hypothetical protein [Pseudomonadota bacterium]
MEEKKQMLSVWSWVGIILSVYGLIVTGAGVYYLSHPETVTALHQLNPSLWWGAIIVVAGVLLLLAGRSGKSGGSD